MIFVEQIVILTSLMSIVMLLLSHYRTKQALQWWYETQSIELSEEAEVAKNGLLQESFFLRRSIELLDKNPTFNSQKTKEKYLNSVEKLYNSVTELINHLSPAYVDDSLPLAVQYLLSAWKIRTTTVSWVMELPSDWVNESPICNRVLLSVLDRLLQVILSQRQIPQQVKVSLVKQVNLHELLVKINYEDNLIVRNIRLMKELNYINRVFGILISGKLDYYQKDERLICRFYWKSDTNSDN